jgi:hypothetical protein
VCSSPPRSRVVASEAQPIAKAAQMEPTGKIGSKTDGSGFIRQGFGSGAITNVGEWSPWRSGDGAAMIGGCQVESVEHASHRSRR